MHVSPLLAPVVALVAWTLVMQVWLYAARLPRDEAGGHQPARAGAALAAALEGIIPDEANWPAHNYAHLMEQPTIFYAIALALVLMGFGGGINVYLAWGYVGLRIVHSLVQATVNVVTRRFLVSRSRHCA